MIDLERSLDRARRPLGDPRRRLAGRRRRPPHRRTGPASSDASPRPRACRCAARRPRGTCWSLPSRARDTPSLAGWASTAFASNQASRCRTTTTATAATTRRNGDRRDGHGRRPTLRARSRSRAVGVDGRGDLPDRSARPHAGAARRTAVGPRRATSGFGQIVLVYAPSDLLPQSSVTGVGALVSVIPARSTKGCSARRSVDRHRDDPSMSTAPTGSGSRVRRINCSSRGRRDRTRHAATGHQHVAVAARRRRLSPRGRRLVGHGLAHRRRRQVGA